MSISRIYSPRTSQPQEAQPLDRSSALAASVGVYAPYALRDVRGLVSPIASSGVSPTTYGSGVGARFDGSANARLDFGSYETVGTKNCTWSTLVRFDSLTPSYTAVFSWVAPGVADYVQLLVNSSGKLAVYVKSGVSAGDYDGTGAYTLQVGRTYRVSLVLPSSGPVIAYVDGREDNRTAWTTLNHAAGLGGTVFVGHDANTSGRNLSGVVNDIAFFRRALSPAEVWQLASGPAWQLFAPIERSIWVPVSAGGGTGTLSATLGTLTSSATGALAISGSVNATLGTLTSTATGAVAISGSVNATLDALTLAATGTVGGGISGSLSSTLNALTSSATGKLAISGSLTGALDALTLAATGANTNPVTGTLNATLGELTLVAYQTVPVETRSTAAGRSKKKRRYEVEIDGEVFDVNSAAEAEEIIREKAKERQNLALLRANKATVRPTRKVVADARKTLKPPTVSAPAELLPELQALLKSVQQQYQDTLRTIEISALLRKREREEEDDEEILLML